MKVDKVDWEITINFFVEGRTRKEAGQVAFKLFKEIPRIRSFSMEDSPCAGEGCLKKEEILNYILRLDDNETFHLVGGFQNA